MNPNETVSSWTHIFTQQIISSEVVVFWLIFTVALLLLVLKTVKYIMKWKNKKLSTADTIHHLNTVLGEMMQLLSTKQTQPSALLQVIQEE